MAHNLYNQTSIDQNSLSSFLDDGASNFNLVPNYTNQIDEKGIYKRASKTGNKEHTNKIEMLLEELGPKPLPDRETISPHHYIAVKPKMWNKHLLYSQRILEECFCGSIEIRSEAESLQLATENREQEWKEGSPIDRKTTIVIRPATWLKRLGIMNGLSVRLFSSSIKGWKFILDSFRLVPDNAPIFEFCKNGNLPAVRELLMRGKASAKDTNSRGRTPLHVGIAVLH